MPEHRPPGGPAESRAIEIFLTDYLLPERTGPSPDFELICARHPAEATALRELKANWDAQEELRELAGLGRTPQPPISKVLRAMYGEAVDPGVSLAAEQPPADSTPTKALVQRLQSSGPTNTRYKVLDEVGRGGMGAVLKVWDADLRRPLAMKIALARRSNGDGEVHASTQQKLLGRFLEEAQITGQLDHPGIVPVHELGLASDGSVYFTMRLVKGVDLKRVFDLARSGEEGWNQTRALGVLLKVCEAMSYAHNKGVVHRDLKPANVMVGKYGEVYVMDWGLARVLGRADRHDLRLRAGSTVSLISVRTERREEREDAPDSPIMTMDGDVLGTPAYMPPEQAMGQTDQLGPWSDVYALGAMMYHLLSGCTPFVPAGAVVTARSVLMRVLEGPPRPLHELAPKAPAELIAICEKAMAREAKRRYPDTISLAEDLRAYMEGRVVAAYETGTWAETRKWVRRNKRLAAAVASGVLLLIAWGVTTSVFAKRDSERLELLAAANAAKDAANRDLKARTREAQAARIAADTQALIAQRKTAEVLSLSAIQELAELEAVAASLWPAFPESLPAYESWLDDARRLVEGRPAEGDGTETGRFSLTEHEAKLAELRSRARPRNSEQREADRRASAYYAEWEQVGAEATWRRRMLGDEAWPEEQVVAAASPVAKIPLSAEQLDQLAWPLVDPDLNRSRFGQEVEGLVLAKRAVALDGEAAAPRLRDTLAVALYRCGRFEEALAQSERAVSESSGWMRANFEQSREFLDGAVRAWTTEPGVAARRRELALLEVRLHRLEALVDSTQTLEFEDAQDRWWHGQLTSLVAGLHELTLESPGRSGLDSAGTSSTNGWGIRRRAEEARSIRARSVDGPENEARWSFAIEDIARREAYRNVRWPSGDRLTPQVGLYPLEPDPRSNLWEFALVQSGGPPPRDAEGQFLRDHEGRFRLDPYGESGIVLVLLPGGRFTMGAQAVDPSKPYYDAAAKPYEASHGIELAPFLLSKYEMTQGQWLRLTGENPSVHQYRATEPPSPPKPLTLLNPVEAVSWVMSVDCLRRFGLCLPTEAQWEFGARGGTSTPYSCGPDPACLAATGNVYDGFANAQGLYLSSHGSEAPPAEAWDDGYLLHSEVGAFSPNPFGLHDVHGNVFEWCRDSFGTSAAFAPLTGERIVSETESRVAKGGSFQSLAVFARSASRINDSKNVQNKVIGVRPAMVIRP